MKTEFEIGEVFQFGFAKLKCEKLSDDAEYKCKGCFFIIQNMCWSICCGSCRSISRNDGEDVIFKLVEE